MSKDSDQPAPRHPALIIHGFLAAPFVMLPIQRRLEQQGFRAHFVRLSVGCVQDVRVLSRQLRDNVQRVLEREDCSRVNLVGVSMGGLVGLDYITSHGPQSMVERLVTVGAPVRGTWAAALAVPLLGMVSKGVWQALPDSSFVRAVLARPLPSDVGVSTISHAGDPIAPPERCHIPGARNVTVPGPRGVTAHQRFVMGPATATLIGQELKRQPELG